MIALLFHLAYVVLPPCEYEDSHNCSWDASTAGIDTSGGSDFVDVNGVLFYPNTPHVTYKDGPDTVWYWEDLGYALRLTPNGFKGVWL